MASKKLWGGRFKEEPDKAFELFGRSLDFDRQLWKQDLAVLSAHVEMLIKSKIISKTDGGVILKGLDEVKTKIAKNGISLSAEDEDIHSYIERELRLKVGEKASLIRIGRSRNDTIVTDTRLYLKEKIQEILKLHYDYLKAWLELAERFPKDVIPGYTHLRRAQPILFPFYCLSHFASGKREHEVLNFALRWADVSTLGAGAISGTSWKTDPEFSAKNLGFSDTFFNALDAVSDRDFLAAFYFASSLVMTHLTRMCEDFILWSSESFGYLELPDRLCTGSSLMPQKKNPDSLELIRGKSARVFGHLSSLFFLLKGLPGGYNRDMQEDKEPLFDTVKTMRDSLEIATKVLRGVSLNKERLLEILEDDSIIATDLADELVKLGYSFAEAHLFVGQLVRLSVERKKSLRELSPHEMRSVVRDIDPKIMGKLAVEKTAHARNSSGGTGTKAVAKAFAEAKAWLKARIPR